MSDAPTPTNPRGSKATDSGAEPEPARFEVSIYEGGELRSTARFDTSEEAEEYGEIWADPTKGRTASFGIVGSTGEPIDEFADMIEDYPRQAEPGPVEPG